MLVAAPCQSSVQEVGDRLLMDPGLSLSAPFDPVLGTEIPRDLLVYVIESLGAVRTTAPHPIVPRKSDVPQERAGRFRIVAPHKLGDPHRPGE